MAGPAGVGVALPYRLENIERRIALYQQVALTAGAASLMQPTTQPYGRIGGVYDAVGNQWFFSGPVTG